MDVNTSLDVPVSAVLKSYSVRKRRGNPVWLPSVGCVGDPGLLTLHMVRMPCPANKFAGNNPAKSPYGDCLRVSSPRRRTLLSLLPVTSVAGPPCAVLVGVDATQGCPYDDPALT